MVAEPELIDDVEDEDTEESQSLSVAEYLSMWGCDPQYDTFPREHGDGHVFYNYSSDGDDLEYLKNQLLPALKRQLMTENVPEDRLLSAIDTDNFEKIKTYVERKIVALEAGETVPKIFRDDKSFTDENGVVYRYDQIQEVMDEPFEMVLSSSDFYCFERAVNQGIDAYLQICFSKDRGDTMEVVSGSAKVRISAESMPVLLRRLFQDGSASAEAFASSILETLGFDEGEWCDPNLD